jgi:hypothetical protein
MKFKWMDTPYLTELVVEFSRRNGSKKSKFHPWKIQEYIKIDKFLISLSSETLFFQPAI